MFAIISNSSVSNNSLVYNEYIIILTIMAW